MTVNTIYLRETEDKTSRIAVGFHGENLEEITEARDKLEQIFGIRLRFLDEYSGKDTL